MKIRKGVLQGRGRRAVCLRHGVCGGHVENNMERAAVPDGKRGDVESSGELSKEKIKKPSQCKNLQENSIGFGNLQLIPNSESSSR